MMELYLYLHALKDFLRFRRIAAWIVVCIMVGAMSFVWKFVAKQESPTQQYADLVSIFPFHLIGLAAAVLTTSIIGSEVAQKTIVYILTRPTPRWKILLFRYLASVTVVAGIGILCVILLSAGAYWGHPFNNELLGRDILAILFGSFAYGAFCMVVSLLVARPMVICIAFTLVWETSISGLPGDLYRLSIYSYMEAIAQHPNSSSAGGGVAFLSGELGNNLLTPSSGYPILILITAVLTVFSLFWFTKFEYVPRDDAD